MEQPVIIKRDKKDVKKFEQWCFKQTIEIEYNKQKLEKERQSLTQERIQLEEAKDSLERDKQMFRRKQESDDKRLTQEQHLFDMKWKLLEEELKKLAIEKQQVQRQKEFYSKVTDYHQSGTKSASSNIVKGELFFVGVRDESALKRRYKDLIKIYHPDNLAGDTGTIQEINRQYDNLKKKLG